MTYARTRLLRFLPIAALALTACHAAKLAVPSDVLGATEALEVTNRSSATGMFVNEDFEIGAFRVRGVDRSATRASKWSAGTTTQTTSDGGYTYRLEGGEVPLEGTCRSTSERTSGRDFLFGGTASIGRASFDCSCGPDARVGLQTGVSATIPVPNGESPLYTGNLLLGDKTFHVRSLHGFEGGASVLEPAGYRADKDGVPFAAVDVLAPGRVFLPREVTSIDRARLTCLLAGVMLYVPPRDRR